MKIKSPVGIVSYGVQIPPYKIMGAEIGQAQGKADDSISISLGVKQKTVPGIDEDTATLSTDAALQALQRWNGDHESINALFIGSESHPYAVKPTGTMVKQALNLSDKMAMADLQFACKAGTQALQIVSSYVASGMIKYGLAIGTDTAQSKPGDVLEFTAGAGSAAFIVGSEEILARLIATLSIATDTPDFWRRPGMKHPEHAGRFSGEPAYFEHVTRSTQLLLGEVKLKPSDIDYCVFHTPNGKFPQAVAQKLGFTKEQLQPGLVVQDIGNTYAAASMIGLARVLDQANANKKILVTSYGSGSGSDSFIFETTPLLETRRKTWENFIEDKIEMLKTISYQEYRLYTANNH